MFRFLVAALLAATLPAAAAEDAAPAKPAAKPAPTAKANADFLAANAKKPGVVSLPGLQYKVLKKGQGALAQHSDCVTVAYKGALIDGTVFDQTEPDKPVTFPAMFLIPGWTVALQLMHEGDEWQLIVPAVFGYGHAGAGDGAIPADQTLVFDIHLIKTEAPVDGACR